MFKREEYQERLKEIGLTSEQIEKLRDVLEEMMNHASRTANKIAYPGGKTVELSRQESLFVTLYEGKAAGINAVYRFLSGDMDAHDEFDD